jgi:hypothetical protein
VGFHGTISFKYPIPPSQAYVDIWGSYGNQDGNGSYKLYCSLYTGEGDPDQNDGHPGDVYVDLLQKGIFAKVSQGNKIRWTQWHFMETEDGNYHKLTNPLIPNSLLWSKKVFGIQWMCGKNARGDISKRKGDDFTIPCAIQQMLRHWTATRVEVNPSPKHSSSSISPPNSPSSAEHIPDSEKHVLPSPFHAPAVSPTVVPTPRKRKQKEFTPPEKNEAQLSLPQTPHTNIGQTSIQTDAQSSKRENDSE